MSSICIIDTSILVEILNVPGKAGQHSEVISELKTKIEAKESLFLPMATIFETGNHIAQNGNGAERRKCAEQFVIQVQKALNGDSPFKAIDFPERGRMLQWLKDFPDSAMRKSGLGDLSIICDFYKICLQNQGRRVYIWSLDGHLRGFSRDAMV
jgi:hypothetical protein